MSTAITTQPRLGIFPMPAADYHADKAAVSKGMLATLLKRRRLYKAEHIDGREEEREPTTDMDKGTLTHTGLLEPELFDDAYAIYPADVLAKNGAASTNAARAFKEEHAAAGKIVLKQEDFDDVLAMIASVKARLGHWLKLESRREHAVYWRDDETDILCRCRPDWLIEKGGCAYIFDLKTTADSSPEAFRRAAEQHRYWLQHAHYSNGVHIALDREVDTEFYFVVVENTFPHTTVLYQLLPSVAVAADVRRCGLMEELAERLATGNWSEPWERDIQPLDIRPWSFE